MAAAMVSTIESEWPAEFLQAIDFFLTQCVVNQDGSPMRFEDIGRRIVPWRSEEAQKGSGFTRFVDMLIFADRWFDRQDAVGWRGPQLSPEERAKKREATAEATRLVLKELKARDAVQLALAEAKRRREERRCTGRRDAGAPCKGQRGNP